MILTPMVSSVETKLVQDEIKKFVEFFSNNLNLKLILILLNLLYPLIYLLFKVGLERLLEYGGFLYFILFYGYILLNGPLLFAEKILENIFDIDLWDSENKSLQVILVYISIVINLLSILYLFNYIIGNDGVNII
jgi:hypothetical protein